jgi:putative tryptophan/tyrosine transport system substrate-binding protein
MTKRITRRACIAAFGTLAAPRRSYAQQPPAPVVGLLDSSIATAAKLSAFYDGLRIEGFVRNRNVTVEYHAADGEYTRLPELAADLVNRRVSLITAFGAPAALAAKGATAEIPIVFAVEPNPIGVGLVASLNHPAANVTGVTGMAVGREQKRLALLHESIPTALTFGLLVNPHNANANTQINDALATAQRLGMQIKVTRASANRDFGNAFAELTQSQAGGLAIADDDLFISTSAELAGLAARHGIPAIFEGAAFAAGGGLMSYGTRLTELHHQAGVYSGLIANGAAPAQLPIYQSTGIEMIVNLRSAKALGVTLPQAVIDEANLIVR